MTVRRTQSPSRQRSRRRTRVPVLRGLLAVLAGVAAALLVSCGSSAKQLIPVAHAGPLLSDFEAVRSAAESANGDCTSTEAALRKTEEDFAALPSAVNAGLRNNLQQGIANLRVRAHEMCVQPVARSTGTTTTTEKPATTATTPTTTTSTETQPATTDTTPTTSTPAGPEGGTPAPEAGESPSPRSEQGGGVGAGEPPGGQEGGK